MNTEYTDQKKKSNPCSLVAVILVLLFFPACRSSPPENLPVTLTVSAASDLVPAFEELGKLFTNETGIKVTFNFGSTGQLTQQIEQGAPVVSFKFNTIGAKRFCDVTRQNVGKPFAIVLDDEVISAPVIRDSICGGQGIISGSFTVKDAVVKYGAFIQSIVDFTIVAFVIFMLVRTMNNMKKKEPAPAPAAPTTKECPHCFTTISIKATRCPNCTSQL